MSCPYVIRAVVVPETYYVTRESAEYRYGATAAGGLFAPVRL